MTEEDFEKYRRRVLARESVTDVSRIKFRCSPASSELMRRLIERKQTQVLFELGDSGWGNGIEIWPLDEPFAIWECSLRAPIGANHEAIANVPPMTMAHQMHCEAQVQSLRLVDGYAELVPVSEFDKTNRRV